MDDQDHPTGRINMTNDAYHAGPGISKSHLDVIASQSPLHYWHKYRNPLREREAPTPALVLGTAIHSIALEPDLFTQEYVVNPGIERRSNAGKAEYAAFVAENEGKVILDDEQYQACLHIRDAIARHPVAPGLLTGGAAEQTFFAIDPETGELIKCRYDYLQDSGYAAIDLKSTEDASPSGFARSAANFRYDLQPAWYFDVNTILYGERPRHWIFMALEKKPPYAIGLYFAKEEDIERAYTRARQDFLKIVEHKNTDRWPDWGHEVMPLDLPRWTSR